MTTLFDKRISRLANASSAYSPAGGYRGIEKESLRVTADGHLSQESHPVGLGSALSNRFITTDFSEALLEFVTSAVPHSWEALRDLCDIHQFVYEQLGDELLWVTSMPCKIPADPEIPLARYGSSNVGRMKTIYRNGLGYRYGRAMQTIAGLHFNYSLPQSFWEGWHELEKSELGLDEFRSASYLCMIRNFRRLGWLVLYLFGSSPALCKSFTAADPDSMPLLDSMTLYEPFATSLRMSDLGYSNKTQAGLNISLNNLGQYVDDLSQAIVTPVPDFEKIGVKVNGEYRQLNSNQLQIENEYYSPVRPKRVANSGERPTAALQRGGIEYVEVRSLDLNVFDPVGISQNVMRFTEAFLVYCMLEDSPLLDGAGWNELSDNHKLVAKRGRDPELRLQRNGAETSLADWAAEMMPGILQVADLLDAGQDNDDYRQAVHAQAALVDNPDATPSARVLQELKEADCSFFEFAMSAARGHRDYFRSLVPLTVDRQKLFADEARASLDRQRQVEAEDSLSFDEYLAAYYRSGQS